MSFSYHEKVVGHLGECGFSEPTEVEVRCSVCEVKKALAGTDTEMGNQQDYYHSLEFKDNPRSNEKFS